MILKPKLVILDEPTSSLDVSVQKQILTLLGSLQAKYGIGYLFISHDLNIIRSVAHRVVVMRHGRVVEQGNVQEMFANPKEDYTRELLMAAVCH
jgi:microcin C transport system ATP-binding protein